MCVFSDKKQILLKQIQFFHREAAFFLEHLWFLSEKLFIINPLRELKKNG